MEVRGVEAHGLELLLEAFLNSLGKVTHATLPLLYALAFFALAPCDQAVSLGAMWRRARRAANRSDGPRVVHRPAADRLVHSPCGGGSPRPVRHPRLVP